MASEWAEMYTSALAQGEGFSRTQKEMIANALDATRYRFLREGRRDGLDEAFALATEHCEHGEFAHYGRFECIDALRVQIRALIDKEPTA